MTNQPDRTRRRIMATFAARIFRHPRWAVENVRLFRRRHAGRAPFRIEDCEHHLVPWHQAVERVLRLGPTEAGSLVRDFEGLPGRHRGPSAVWDASDVLARTLWVAVRCMRPLTVVETGVARGLSSAVILRALEANGGGHLHSIDLPPLSAGEPSFTGQLVPTALRSSWDLRLGPSRLLLPQVLDDVGAVDIFLHDADHTYSSQIEEYRTVWPYLQSGGLLVSDDVGNPAFFELAAAVSAEPVLILQPDKPYPLGLLRKG